MTIHRLRPLVLLLLLLTLTSCFEIYEEIRIKEKGNGSVALGFDLGEFNFLGTLANRYLQKSLFDEIVLMPSRAGSKLNGIKGISNVRYSTEVAGGKVFLTFDFDDSKALNKAYYALFFRDKRWYEPRPVLLNSRRIKKRNVAPVVKYYVRKNQDRINDMSMLSYITLRSEVFAPSAIRSVSNTRYVVQAGGKSAAFKMNVRDFLSNTPDVGVRIRY